MAKRRHDFDVLDVRRKSARLLAIGPAKDDTLRPQMISEDLWCGIGPSGAIASCKRYNEFRQFAPGRTADGRIKASANAVAKAVLAIEESMRKARQDLVAKTMELERRVLHFADASMGHAGSYAGSNLLDLDTDDLCIALEHIQISDAQHFLAYVETSIKHAFARETRSDERARDDSSEVDHSKFTLFDKIMALIGLMLDHNGEFACFNMVLLAKLYIMARVYGCVDAPEDNRVGCDTKEYPEDHSKHSCEIEAGGICWYDPPDSEKGIQYWNFASGARTLLAAYKDEGHGCSVDDGTCRPTGYTDRSEKCLHINSAKLLDWLQKKAWGEIRSNVMRVVGHRLPVELADSIFEFALASESIPAIPGVYEKFRPENTRINKDRGMRYRSESRLKEGYVCPRTRPDDYSNYRRFYNTESDPGDEQEQRASKPGDEMDQIEDTIEYSW
ncbi:hypothetical protein LTR56_019160 [Elasticomyces elasticus]|nr:hypothetical protein LTR56_019160 [Elasticomyces elasticus]KAK3635158.1 hypothetical protein LTR22_019299 [Elasticomyces elasticus]KAK4911533.1 hypothetical protein LTR49_019944 [Elasticomyces elasticus]KAK5751044.1 hypothetical protein LTS12_018854 [Elasticomyces elasticus]